MKLYTKIISMLLVAGLASAGAQSAKNFYVKGSVGYADTDNDSIVDSINKAGLKAGLDESLIYGFELGLHAGNNFSFGFEYFTFDSEFAMKASALTQSQADAFNTLFELTNLNFDAGYDAYTSSDLDLDSFMFIVNYEYFLNDQFSILTKCGLGLFDVKQSLKVSRDTDGAGTAQSPESLINASSDDTVFAYQLGVNMNYYITEAVALTAGIRYIDASDMDFKFGTLKITEDDNDLFSYDVGLSYNF